MKVDLDCLTSAYLRNSRNTQKGDDFWAWEEVHRLVETDVDSGWKITLLLLEKAESDQDVSAIGAGPLEDLIDKYGHDALDRAEKECENNPRLQLALSIAGVLFYYSEFEGKRLGLVDH